MDPAKTTVADVRYDVRILNGPMKFTFRSVQHEVVAGSDIAVIVRSVTSKGMRVSDDTVVAFLADIPELLRLNSFLREGGVIGLHRDLV